MPVDPFVVHIARLRRQTGARWHEVRQGPFDPEGDLEPRTPVDSAVPGGADASCDVVLESFPGGVMATGTVRAPWRGVCRRCAVPVEGDLEVAFKERFVDRERLLGDGDGDGGGRGAGSGAGPDAEFDEEAYPIVDDELDLGPLVRELLLLELPLAPLCRPDCRGLCPGCGADRNEESCTCVAPVDPRWANLDVLRPGPEGDRPAQHARERS
jgi:uncharacterized protein